MPERGGRALPLVLKVGGSLAESGRLGKILSMVAKATVPVVVVPGGGPFADVVREQHDKLGYGMATAHRMAMLGMQQMAEVIAEHDACFRITETLEAIEEAIQNGDIAVWAPLLLMSRDAEIRADWTTTSDSLAARLAELLGGAPLVLLKSVDVAEAADAEALAHDGVVDAFFPVLVRRARLRWRVIGPAGDGRLAALLASETLQSVSV